MGRACYETYTSGARKRPSLTHSSKAWAALCVVVRAAFARRSEFGVAGAEDVRDLCRENAVVSSNESVANT